MNRIALEFQILGQIILGQDASSYAFEKLNKDCFSDKRNGFLFDRLHQLFKDQTEMTILTIDSSFEDLFLDLTSNVVSLVGFRSHVNLLKEVVSYRNFLI